MTNDPTWPAIRAHQWPDHAKLTEPDGDTVRVVTTNPLDVRDTVADTAHDEARPGRPPVSPPTRDPARLTVRESAADHRAAGVRAFNEAARLAVDSLDLPKRGAKDWARSLGYDTKSHVVKAIDEAVSAIHEAIDLVAAGEEGTR